MDCDKKDLKKNGRVPVFLRIYHYEAIVRVRSRQITETYIYLHIHFPNDKIINKLW
ncbi:hypothetical protein JZI27_23945 [Brevibacillus sp. AY1]|nr:hypothetical protein [Brevibacillus sp. AY1]